MTRDSIRRHVLLALAAGAMLRAYFVLRLPYFESGDTPIYAELAANWLDHGVYGLAVDGRVTAVDIRMPGYPAFLAALYALVGRSALAVMSAQAVVDLATCLATAGIAAIVAGEASRARVAIAALWLAALCPFTANYTAVVLTECLATFLTALATVCLAWSEATIGAAEEWPAIAGRLGALWIGGGLLAGLATLVRPESALLVIAAGLVRLVHWRRPADWPKLRRAALSMGTGLMLPIAVWGARNFVTLHELRLLAPYYSERPGEIAPRGFYSWTATWLWRFGDVEAVPWKLDEERIALADVPSSAFDSPEERREVAALLAHYNETTTLEPAWDAEFAAIAAARTARHPLRTYVSIPLRRAWAVWLTPRVEMLPVPGSPVPIGERWSDDPWGYAVTAGFALLGVLYLGAAVAGGWGARHRPSVALLVAYLVVRTTFLTTALTPEPRYVLECFPALLALAAQCLVDRNSKIESGLASPRWGHQEADQPLPTANRSCAT